MIKSLLLSLLVISASAHAVTEPPHIGPVGGHFSKIEIYRVEKLIERKLQDSDKGAESVEDQQIAMLLAVGKKASKWIEVVNTARPVGQKLDLSSPGSSGGIPMDNPIKSSTEIIMKSYNDFLAKSSPLITDVVTSSQELSVNPPVSDEEFVTTLRTLDRIYSSTIRWAGQREYKAWYINKAIYDIRGFTFLKNTPNLEETLNSYPTLSTEDKAKYYGWLFGLCKNGDFGPADCKVELDKYVGTNKLFNFYNRFLKYGQSMHDLFFTLKKTRAEIKWNADRTILNSPFQTPERTDVQKWLKENIEDEWQGAGFNLVIDYKKNMSNYPRIEFKEGVTAHVNELGGNLITMEAEYPIETKDQKYTIRHEYGHVIGFQDCYLEFYDTSEKSMVYYEVDVNNIMCSRNGKLQATHIEQLQKSYK
ncbi:hypothetical protein SHI21_17460 [Bacteriovorax sp. PP10]|uniref:Uncharacterized protein n=1 Tax=Bacteriovorax antarcticus TaxID=3088717 RepID=A0ABU5VY82_9BACT|nr:hypothetical protein [Bacteriovorax sp. PP10]MEA9358024.1 hypothetical protein [Bacteriovorax sp. PP10]